MVKSLWCYKDIFCQLVSTHMITIRSQIKDMVINLYIWAFCSLVIMGYIMQSFGLASDYGCFQLAGIIGTVGLFEVYGNVTRNVMDFEGDRSISYYLTLPTKPWVIFGSMACFYTLIGVMLSAVIFPFCWMIMYNSFNIAAVSWLKAALIVVLSNLFFAIFTLLITAHVGSISKMRNVWTRFIFPLWILGAFQFSWAVVHNLSKPLSYIMLCNPIVYVMEGCRAALLGQEGSLPWEWCCVALLFSSVFCWMIMMKKMRRLLDIV